MPTVTETVKNAFRKLARALRWTDEAVKVDSDTWGDYDARMLRYYLYFYAYTNNLYSDFNKIYTTYKQKMGLYRYTRGLYNPVERIVEGYVSFIYGGELDLDNLNEGAIPIAASNPAILEPIRRLFVRSNLKRTKSTYARLAATFGDCFIKVVDNPANSDVYLEFLDPRKVDEVRKDPRGNIVYIRISYKDVGEDGKDYIYTEVIDSKGVTTYRDDVMFAYSFNPQAEASWSHNYGFVPVVHSKFRDVGHFWAYNAFHAQLPKINAVTDALSLLTNNMRNAVEMVFHAKNITKGTLTTNSDEPTKDSIRIVYSNGGGELVPLIKSLDYAGALQVIQTEINEIDADLPILSLHKLRDLSIATKPGIKAAFSDAIKRIEDIKAGLDASLEEAIAMALTIMYLRGQAPGLSADYWQSDDWGFYIRDRDPIDDSLSSYEVVQILAALDYSSPGADAVLKRAGLDEIERVGILSDAKQIEDERQRTALILARLQAASAAGAGEIGQRLRGEEPNQLPLGAQDGDIVGEDLNNA